MRTITLTLDKTNVLDQRLLALSASLWFFFNSSWIVGKTVIHNLNRLVVRAVIILFRNACLKNDIHRVHRIECENISAPLRLFLNHVFFCNTIIIVDTNVY